MVVGADVALDRADPQPAVLAGDVVDQVVQRLRHGRARGAGEEVVQVGGRPAGVQRPADAGLRTRNTVAPPEDSTSATSGEGVGQLGDQRAGRDQREVGLGEHVVDRLGQQPRIPSAAASAPPVSSPRPAVDSTPLDDDAQPRGLGEQVGHRGQPVGAARGAPAQHGDQVAAARPGAAAGTRPARPARSGGWPARCAGPGRGTAR